MKTKLKLLLTLTALASCEAPLNNTSIKYNIKPLCETICLRYVTCDYLPGALHSSCLANCVGKMILNRNQPNSSSYSYENEEMKKVSCDALQKRYGIYNKTN